MALLNYNIKNIFQSNDTIKQAIQQTDVYNKQQFKRYQNIYYTDKYDLNSYYYKGVFKNLSTIMDKNKLSKYKQFVMQNKPIAPDQKFHDIKKYDHLVNFGVSNVQTKISHIIQEFKPTSLINKTAMWVVDKKYKTQNVVNLKKITPMDIAQYFKDVTTFQNITKVTSNYVYNTLNFNEYTIDTQSKHPFIDKSKSTNIPSVYLTKYNITYNKNQQVDYIQYEKHNTGETPKLHTIWNDQEQIYKKFKFSDINNKLQNSIISIQNKQYNSIYIPIYTQSNPQQTDDYQYINKKKQQLVQIQGSYDYTTSMISIDDKDISGSYVSDYSINYDSEWTEQQAIGHQMPVHTYIGLTKAFNTQFTVICQPKTANINSQNDAQKQFIQQMKFLKQKVKPNRIGRNGSSSSVSQRYQYNHTTNVNILGTSFEGILTSLNVQYVQSMFHIDESKNLHPIVYQVTLSMTIVDK